MLTLPLQLHQWSCRGLISTLALRASWTLQISSYPRQYVKDRLIHVWHLRWMLTVSPTYWTRTIQDAVKIALAQETAENGTQQLQQQPQLLTLHKVGQTNKHSHRPPAKETFCYQCSGNNHGPLECCLRDAGCHSCKKKGHLAWVCHKYTHERPPQSQSKRSNQQQWFRTNHQVEVEEDVSDNFDCYQLFIIQAGAQNKPLAVTIKANNCDLGMEIDTGASCQ